MANHSIERTRPGKPGRVLSCQTLNYVSDQVMTAHNSDSAAQRHAEAYMLRSLEESLGATFSESSISGMTVKPDGVDQKRKIVVEVFARIGKLKSAQTHKVQADILKLVFIEKITGEQWRKIICFACPEAAAALQGQSWASEAVRAFGVEVHVVPLPPEKIESVKAAQERQIMVNAK